MAHILKCESCGSYGIDEMCSCGSKRQRIIPAKYSPEDKYGDYRRKAKEGMNENQDGTHSENTNENQDKNIDEYSEEFDEESLEDE